MSEHQQATKHEVLADSRRSGKFTEDTEAVSFTWPQQKVGDCHQIGGTMILVSDGKAKFTCTTWTDHSVFGDVWHASFSAQDQYGIELFSLNERNSPSMSGGGPHVSWSGEWDYPAEKMHEVHNFVQAYSC